MTEFKTMKVLYAEDENLIREEVSAILAFFFKEVIAVSNGDEALLSYEEHKPDVLIFDICMPELDGLDLLRKIRIKDKNTPVIMLTAHTENPYLMRAVELNITRYLVKPFSRKSLTEALKECSKIIFKNSYIIPLNNNYFFNSKDKTLFHKETLISLTCKELKLVEIMALEPNSIHAFDNLIESIWGWENISKEALKSLVKGLRKKLPEPLINNIFGVGYTFRINL